MTGKLVENITQAWLTSLNRLILATTVTDGAGNVIGLGSLDFAVHTLRERLTDAVKKGGRVIMFGNGGSLAIAAHLATDFSLAGWPTIALTDAVALTSHTNDFGGESNFSKQLELLRVGPWDVLIALSCSGKSPNIVAAAQEFHTSNEVITFSGFESSNPLRKLGTMNFYVPAHEYGMVQLAHEAVLHAACDFEQGWTPHG